MTIYFRNGTSVEVPKQIAESLVKQLEKGCSKFQSFSDETGSLLLILNLDQIVY